jgi:hypothetical protein
MTPTFLKMTMGLGIMVLAAAQARAEGAANCAPRAVVLERLQEGYGETRQSIGLASQGTVVEVFAALRTGTWTITVTLPSGLACLVASGQAFETLTEALPPQGNDA